MKDFKILEAVCYPKHLIIGRIIQRETKIQSKYLIILFACPEDQANMSFICTFMKKLFS